MSDFRLLMTEDREEDGSPAVFPSALDNAFRAVLEGTSRQLGVEFLQALAASLPHALGSRGALVAEYVDGERSARILAIHGVDVSCAEFPVVGSFAEVLLSRTICSIRTADFPGFSDGSIFPAQGIESFVGIRLDSSDGRALGLLAVLDDKPVEAQARARDVLSIFAPRAGAELERLEVETRRFEVEQKFLHSQKLEALGTFAGGIAHDINNILTFIWGHAQILELKLSGSRESESVQGILSGCARARDLSRQILLFGRRLDPIKRPVKIDEIARETLGLLSASVPPSIRVDFSSSPDLPLVLGDSSQLVQVLTNLCANAIHAMLRTDSGHLELKLENSGDFVRIVVADNGEGIAPDVLPRIFEPFFSTKDINQGTGLGLSVVHGIVQNHGGSIEVRSTVDEGTCFEVVLPVHQSIPFSETATLPVFESRGNGERILVVDDDPSITDILSHLLEILDYRFNTFNQPSDALEEFRMDPSSWSAVISDFSMPGMSGSEFAKEIHRISPELPILLTSGYESIDPRDDDDSWSRCAFIAKPFQAADLAKILRKCLSKT